MRIKYQWISGWVLYSIHLFLYTTYFTTVLFDNFLVFGLKPSNLVDLFSIIIYCSYLLLVLFYVLNNRKAQDTNKQQH